EADADDFVRSEKTVGDPLPQRIGVKGFAEVFDVGNLLRFLGSGREADLRRGREVFQHFAPRGIIGRAATVTLVHNNEVEKVRRELLVDVLFFLGAGDRLVKTKVNLE